MQRFLLIEGLERGLPDNELLAEAEAWCSPNEIDTTEIVLGIDVGGNVRIIKHPQFALGSPAGRSVNVA